MRSFLFGKQDSSIEYTGPWTGFSSVKTPATLPTPSNSGNVAVTLESISDYNLGLGYFGTGHKIFDTDYSILAEDIDFYYDEAWDGSGTHAIDKYDDGISGTLDLNKVVRVVNDVNGVAQNVADPAGLNLMPIVKDASLYKTPKANEFYIDPIKGTIVLPRPAYYSKLGSLDGITNAAIGSAAYEVNSYMGAYFTGGIYGNGLLLNPLWLGVEVYGTFSIAPALNINRELTISFWSYWGQVGGAWDAYYTIYLDSTGASYIELMQGTYYQGGIRIILNNALVYTSAFVQNENTWVHNVFTISADNISSYHNGVKVIDYNGLVIADTCRLVIGSKVYPYIGAGSNIYFDNLKIWDQILLQPTFEYIGYASGYEEALHPIYGSVNGYKPKISGVGGVGYYKASSSGSLVKGKV